MMLLMLLDSLSGRGPTQGKGRQGEGFGEQPLGRQGTGQAAKDLDT